MASSRLLLASRRAASFLRTSSLPHSRLISTLSFDVVEGLQIPDSLECVKVDGNGVNVALKYSDSNEWVKLDRNAATIDEERFGLPYKVMEGLKYSETHEWVKVNGNVATVGLTQFGFHYKFPKRRLSTVMNFINGIKLRRLPMEGEEIGLGNRFAEVTNEVDKTAVLYSPVSGKIVEVNKQLYSRQSSLVYSPYEEGWLMKVVIKNACELERLMEVDDYSKFCDEEKAAICLMEMQIRDSVMKGLKYSDSHMWVKLHGNVATVGVTKKSQSNMYGRQHTEELPNKDEEVVQGNCFGKYKTESYDNPVGFVSPISGKVVEINNKCGCWRTPDWFHLSPYEEGWMMKVEIKDASELEELMDVDNYVKFCHEEVVEYLNEKPRSISESGWLILDGWKYLDTHEYVYVNGNVATIGIGYIGVAYIGSVKHVKLPRISEQVSQRSRFCQVETVKGTCDLYSPVSGKVIEVNDALKSSPHLVNVGLYTKQWIMKVEMKDASELEKLMDEDTHYKFAIKKAMQGIKEKAIQQQFFS